MAPRTVTFAMRVLHNDDCVETLNEVSAGGGAPEILNRPGQAGAPSLIIAKQTVMSGIAPGSSPRPILSPQAQRIPSSTRSRQLASDDGPDISRRTLVSWEDLAAVACSIDLARIRFPPVHDERVPDGSSEQAARGRERRRLDVSPSFRELAEPRPGDVRPNQRSRRLIEGESIRSSRPTNTRPLTTIGGVMSVLSPNVHAVVWSSEATELRMPLLLIIEDVPGMNRRWRS